MPSIAPKTIKSQSYNTKIEYLKNRIKNLIKEVVNEASTNAIMLSKVENDTLDNVLTKNVGIPFDTKEVQEILFKQAELGVKALTQRSGTEIKFSMSDMFGNNKINVLKKLKNMSDPNTLVYANFFSAGKNDEEVQPSPTAEPGKSEKVPTLQPTETKVYIKLSQPFEDKNTDKLDILGDFIKQLELK
jgi:hypothetical protein